MSLIDQQAPDFTLSSTAGEEMRLSDTLDSGPSVVLLNRGYWCSYCAEQLQSFSALEYDLWRNHGVDVLPILVDLIPRLVEMRDRFDLRLQLLSDPDLETSRAYTGTEETDTHGTVALAGTFVIDEDGIVQYEQVAENAADRTYANYVRRFIGTGYEDSYPDN